MYNFDLYFKVEKRERGDEKSAFFSQKARRKKAWSNVKISQGVHKNLIALSWITEGYNLNLGPGCLAVMR